MSEKIEVDYVVIGGGIMGCLTSLELAEKGADTLLIEKETIASGASGGIGKRGVRANNRDLRELPLMAYSKSLWEGIEEKLETPLLFEQIGHLLLYEREVDFAGASARAWMQNHHSIETHILCSEEVQSMEPEISTHILGALFCPKDGVSDHSATTYAASQSARKKGVHIFENTNISSVEGVGTETICLNSECGKSFLVKKKLLLLSNAHVPEFLKTYCHLSLPVWPRLFQAITSKPTELDIPKHLIGHAHRRLAMKPLNDGVVMISGGWSGRWDKEEAAGIVVSEQVEKNLNEAKKVFPQLDEIEIHEATAEHVESQCIDGIPIIDTPPGIDNIIYGTAWSGHGWAIAPAIAQLLATWAHENTVSELLLPLSFNRFNPK